MQSQWRAQARCNGLTCANGGGGGRQAGCGARRLRVLVCTCACRYGQSPNTTPHLQPGTSTQSEWRDRARSAPSVRMVEAILAPGCRGDVAVSTCSIAGSSAEGARALLPSLSSCTHAPDQQGLMQLPTVQVFVAAASRQQNLCNHQAQLGSTCSTKEAGSSSARSWPGRASLILLLSPWAALAHSSSSG